MEVEKAKVLGFCFGVRRAIDMVAQDAEEHGPLETFGTTVHNPHVVGDLEGKGAKVVGTLDDVESGTVAITAHGVGEEIYQTIEEKGYRLVDTTCPETNERYAAAQELASRADLLIVVGGKHSANTRKLAETCRRTGVETYHIESADEIQSEWVVGKQHVGVTAGASTPDSLIDTVVERLEELGQVLEEEERGKIR
ncbi:MAG: hypothetical protein ACE5IJ_08670 [Thermoplasmata archaeon]